MDTDRRRELRTRAKQTHPEAGVYRLVHRPSGRALLAAAVTLASIQNRLAFARATNSTSALDLRLRPDMQRDGIAAFDLEILETVQPPPEMTAAALREELATLLALWRERHDPALLY